MKHAPLASVVLCTYNRAGLLRGALESLSAQERIGAADLELLVVDDASSDGSRAVAEAAGARVAAGLGHGIASARNIGVAAARGRFVAFFDDDQRASRGWLAALLEGARASGALVAAGPRLLAWPPGLEPDLDPRLPRLLGQEPARGASGFLDGPHLPNTGNVLVLRELFDRLGGFDESLLEGGEDTEWFLRVRRAGLPIWWADAARVEHLIDPGRLEPEALRRRAARQGTSAARIAARHGGLARECIRWTALWAIQSLLLAAARLRGDRRQAAYRAFVRAHAGAFLRQALPPGGRGGPLFRSQDRAGGGV